MFIKRQSGDATQSIGAEYAPHVVRAHQQLPVEVGLVVRYAPTRPIPFRPIHIGQTVIAHASDEGEHLLIFPRRRVASGASREHVTLGPRATAEKRPRRDMIFSR